MLAQNFEQIQAGAFPKSPSLGALTPASIINKLLPFIFAGAAIALLVYLIMGGFQIMFSQGDPKAAQSGKGKITNALVGFVIIILAFTIVQLFGQLLGIDNTLFGQIFSNNVAPHPIGGT